MRLDKDIHADVEAELNWEPNVDPSDIALKVKDGVVTLAGFVPSYSQKYDAERAAKRVAGVKAVANDLEVRLPHGDERPDPDIAHDAVHALQTSLPYSSKGLKAVVRSGWVTLEGNVEWDFQRRLAEEGVRKIKGVKGVVNAIKVQPKVNPTDVKKKIEEALKRSAEIDAKNIEVEAEGGIVTLKGKVRAWAEREEAEKAAWRAPGVQEVRDQIVVVA